MKIKNLIVFGCLIILGVFTTGFIYPNPEVATIENGGESFAEFLSHFEKTELPFEVKTADLKKYKNFQKDAMTQKVPALIGRSVKSSPIRRTKYIPEVAKGRFKRMGPPEIRPVARFYPNEKTVAVIYKSLPRFGGNINEYYKLMVYDLRGNVVFPKKDFKKKQSKKRRAQIGNSFELGYSSTQSTMAFKIDKLGRIWKNTYDNVWKKGLKETGIRENELIDFKLTTTEVFQFNELGVAVQLKEIPTEARASLD